MRVLDFAVNEWKIREGRDIVQDTKSNAPLAVSITNDGLVCATGSASIDFVVIYRYIKSDSVWHRLGQFIQSDESVWSWFIEEKRSTSNEGKKLIYTQTKKLGLSEKFSKKNGNVLDVGGLNKNIDGVYVFD